MNCSAQEVQLFLLAQGWAVQALHHLPPPGLSRGGSGVSTGLSGDTPGGWRRDLVDHSDQADVEGPAEDLTCSRPVELEVLDQAWAGPVDQVAAVRQKVEVNSSDPWDLPQRASA